jgi:hypothetical protein
LKEDWLSCRRKLEGKLEEAVGCLERCFFCAVSPADEIYRKVYAQKMLWSVVKYSNVDTNCARMDGFSFCAVETICAERNFRCHVGSKHAACASPVQAIPSQAVTRRSTFQRDQG